MSPSQYAVRSLLAMAVLSATLSAGVPVRVTWTGAVEFNSITAGALGNVGNGEAVTLSFLVDSDTFVNGPSFPTRGYEIDKPSFKLTFDSAVLGYQEPFGGTPTGYFVLRDNDPAVDGFLVSTNVENPIGVPISQAGILGQFINNTYVTYRGVDLFSLDILDALGTYDFTGLTVFNWTIDDGPFNPLGIIFETLTIEVADETWVDLGGASVGINGLPTMHVSGPLTAGSDLDINLVKAPANALMLFRASLTSTPVNVVGGTLYAIPFDLQLILAADANGEFSTSAVVAPGAPPGVDFYFQFIVQDASSVYGITLSNAMMATTP
jgi:hypothetical protein